MELMAMMIMMMINRLVGRPANGRASQQPSRWTSIGTVGSPVGWLPGCADIDDCQEQEEEET